MVGLYAPVSEGAFLSLALLLSSLLWSTLSKPIDSDCHYLISCALTEYYYSLSMLYEKEVRVRTFHFFFFVFVFRARGLKREQGSSTLRTRPLHLYMIEYSPFVLLGCPAHGEHLAWAKPGH